MADADDRETSPALAMGSTFFYPSNFSDLADPELRRATFFATPILKRIDPAQVPFARGFLPAAAATDPNPHPWEGDGVRWLSRLDVFRGGELVDQWSTFDPGIVLRPATFT